LCRWRHQLRLCRRAAGHLHVHCWLQDEQHACVACGYLSWLLSVMHRLLKCLRRRSFWCPPLCCNNDQGVCECVQ
jgi:hypothetical protein